MEAELFNAGIRPAINPGLSVSRVGGSAQIKAMKKIAGPIRVELAQYRELSSFAQFGSDLDKDTLDRLRQGERIVEILKQPQYKPLPVEKQVVILYAVTRKYLTDVNVERSLDFEYELLNYIDTHNPEIYNEILSTGELSADLEERLKNCIETFKSTIKI
jgi:F-type H+-transporting ATPase subunit alpha